MLISKHWLNEFVTTPKGLSDSDLAQKITLSTVEVEGMKNQAAALEHIVVGVIKSVAAHPNADRLRVCQVDVGPSTPRQLGAQGLRRCRSSAEGRTSRRG